MNAFIDSKPWEWIFSGIGVAVLSGLIAWVWRRKRSNAPQNTYHGPIQNHTSDDNINIQTKGDVAVAKDSGTVIQMKDSQIGVLGDHAHVEGGIHFGKKGDS